METQRNKLLQEMLDSVPDGIVDHIVIGKHWTAVSATTEGNRRCGLASTIQAIDPVGAGHVSAMNDSDAKVSAKILASRLNAGNPALSGIAAAALNALLQLPFARGFPVEDSSFDCLECNAEEILFKNASARRIVLAGHFPFTERLRAAAQHLDVLEFNPRPGDLPAEAAPEVLPRADLVAITGMAWVNGTLPPLLQLCRPSAEVLILGASTPLSPILFSYGVDYLCGALVENVDSVMQAAADGAAYRELIPLGVRLITLKRKQSQYRYQKP